MKFTYKCTDCGSTFEIKPELTVCPACATKQEPETPLTGVLEVVLEGQAPEDWEVMDLLPVPEEFFPPAPVGDTPLWEPRNLRREYGAPNLYIKDDGANPTSSFKDRASYLVSAFARQHGIEDIVLASTGNAGSSMAGIGAAAGQRVTLFLPEAAPPAKIIQALQYGARVFKVRGNYDFAYALSQEYSKAHGGMNRNTAYNPMTMEGKKTVSLEIFRQLGRVPDHVFVPTGDGCIIGGVFKGFLDLKRLDITDRMPTIWCVQSDKSDAINRALENGKFEKISSSTLADSISVDVPANGRPVLRWMKEHGGRAVTVEDASIPRAQAKLSSSTGLFTEPAGATAFAGFLAVKDQLPKDDTFIVLATGNGLKDTNTAMKGVNAPDVVIESLNDIP